VPAPSYDRAAPIVWVILLLLTLTGCSAGHPALVASPRPSAKAAEPMPRQELGRSPLERAVGANEGRDASPVEVSSAPVGGNGEAAGTPVVPSAVDTSVGFRDAAADIGPVIWTTGVDPTTKAPTSEVRAFPAQARVIYATAQIRRLQKGATIAAAWSYNGTPIEGFDRSVTSADDQRNVWIEFHLDRRNGGAWPAGTYAVTLTVNGHVAEHGAVVVGTGE
jgi:hypothetical protein